MGFFSIHMWALILPFSIFFFLSIKFYWHTALPIHSPAHGAFPAAVAEPSIRGRNLVAQETGHVNCLVLYGKCLPTPEQDHMFTEGPRPQGVSAPRSSCSHSLHGDKAGENATGICWLCSLDSGAEGRLPTCGDYWPLGLVMPPHCAPRLVPQGHMGQTGGGLSPAPSPCQYFCWSWKMDRLPFWS